LSDGQLERAGQPQWQAYHGLDLLLIVALLQSLLELILSGNVGGIVLVYLLPFVSTLELPLHRQLHTRLYEFSRNVAMLKCLRGRLWALAPMPSYSRESCASSSIPLFLNPQGRWDATCRIGCSTAGVAWGSEAAVGEMWAGIAIARQYAVSARNLEGKRP
jgi:hypothetical protein